MKEYIIWIAIFIFDTHICFAQNLVPNPSFESHSQCPNNYNQVDFATGWFKSLNNNNPLYHTEYLNACGASIFSVPSNTWGLQAAATGQGYMATVTMAPSVQTNYRENIFAQLTAPLIVNQCYEVSFKISHTDNSQFSSNNFGVKFSTTSNFSIDNNSAVFSTGVVTDKNNWTTVSGTFIADSAYQYIGLGNFFTDANTIQSMSCTSCSFNLNGYYLDDVSVTMGGNSVATITAVNTACAGDLVNFGTTVFASYKWNFDDPLSGSADSSALQNPSHIYNQAGVYEITLFVNGSCSGDTFRVSISTPSTAAFSYQMDSCSGEVSFHNSSTGAITNYWDFGDGTISYSSHPSHIYAASGNYTVSLTTNPGTLCSDTAGNVIQVVSSIDKILFISNAFTPNGDGLNDEFSINSFNNCEYFQLQIFNRWGQLIHEAEGYQVNWNGKSKSVNSPDGVYVYRLISNNTEKAGHVTLFR